METMSRSQKPAPGSGLTILPATVAQYHQLDQAIMAMSPEDAAHQLRHCGKADLFFLVSRILTTSQWIDPERPGVSFWDKQWLIDRCREIQFDGEDRLNIWARYHCKSTIATFAFSIFTILNNPNVTIGIFSVTKGVADGFVAQIKYELESNENLIDLYDDVLYKKPANESKSWTVEKGFTVKRSLNLRDNTVRGFGLVDTAFTGARCSHQLFDDSVNESSVSTPEMIDKVNERWELALNVGMPGVMRYYIGTFYLTGDSYHHMAGRGVTPRIHPCYEIDYDRSEFDEKTGLPVEMYFHRDKPVLFSKDHLDKEERLAGPKTFGVQMLCFPQAGAVSGFERSWLHNRYTKSPQEIARHCNTIVLVDPASDRKKSQSKTAMWVVGLGDDSNYYILDLVLDTLNLHERTETLFRLVQQWKPQQVRYERYSMQSDIPHIEYVMEQRSFRFRIDEVGGSTSKDDRIERLIPLFAAGQMWLPQSILMESKNDGIVDILDKWIKGEYLMFPNVKDKDGMDGLSRLVDKDLFLPWPKPRDFLKRNPDAWQKLLRKPERRATGTWMAA